MIELIKEIREADLVITVKYRGGMKTIKNRTGESGQQLDMADVLELLMSYQPDTLQNPIKKWIKEAKSYLSV